MFGSRKLKFLNILKGKGISNAKILKGEYEAKQEFPDEWEGSKQKPSMGGV